MRNKIIGSFPKIITGRRYSKINRKSAPVYDKLVLGILLFTPLVCFSAPRETVISFEKKVYSSDKSSDSTVYKASVMQKGNKIRVEETFPNSDEIGLVMISDEKECWYIPAAGNIQKMPPIKDVLEYVGIKKETNETAIKIDKRKIDLSSSKMKTNYKNYTETVGYGSIPRIVENYDASNVLQSRIELKSIEEETNISDYLFARENVKFSDKALEIAKKMHFE